ncbi:unnamed protein product [Sphenostylis stenocarpa]|uniref:Uncharacterized protein n=1 Tax=Sphenostylis stenocarpa TaxID=92480 RepID=A0AA86S6R0_9FABA|nr:unnamed protein product [Sphenostylis stenocarpa]
MEYMVEMRDRGCMHIATEYTACRSVSFSQRLVKEYEESQCLNMATTESYEYECKKGLWNTEEDTVLINYVKKHGKGKWSRIPKVTGLKRSGKSCRLRWMNYLSPDVKRGDFSEEEEDLVIRLHNLLGNRFFLIRPILIKVNHVSYIRHETFYIGDYYGTHNKLKKMVHLLRWSLIAGRIPGRTDNQVKNFWNTHLSKKLSDDKKKKSKVWVTPKCTRTVEADDNCNSASKGTSDEANKLVHENCWSDDLMDFSSMHEGFMTDDIGLVDGTGDLSRYFSSILFRSQHYHANHNELQLFFWTTMVQHSMIYYIQRWCVHHGAVMRGFILQSLNANSITNERASA